jgi:hypothetical protein
VIGLPFNDHKCLGSITEVVAELVATEDPVIVELARKHRTTDSLINYIRSLPQRDDDGDPEDGPKVETCDPPQRLRIPAENPNCLERACLFAAVAEFIDPRPTRQLATLDMPMGLHTFPLENGVPVILDPSVTRNCIDCGLVLASGGAIEIEPHQAIDWTAMLAEQSSGNVRNGPSRVRRARNAVMRLVDEHVPPTQGEVDAIGWMFALAEVLARSHRNMPWLLAAAEYLPPEWKSGLAKIAGVAGNVGLSVGAAALRSKLDSLGIGGDMVGLVEQELNREGLTMGVLAHPPKLTTFASFQNKRAT